MIFGLVAAVALLTPLAACSSAATTQHVSVATVATDMRSPGVVLIDVRTAGEFAAGHIAGAVNIDVKAPDFAQRTNALDKTARYALYCHSGTRSAAAAQKMTAAGFDHVADLAGGLQAWSAAGQPLVTG
jgi:rhodanese-related sulfurtransferase